MSPSDSALRAAVIEAARAGQLDPELARRALTALSRGAHDGGAAALRAAGLPPAMVEWLIGRAGVAPTRTGTPEPVPGSGPVGITSSFFRRSYPPGSRVGPFTIEGELGRGGMGVVLRARDDAGRPVALKLVLAARETSLERFSREIAALAALDHPNVVRYLGSGDEPAPWLAMELVEGEDLKAILERVDRLTPDVAARLLAGVARGVAHAHEEGIVHRDLKPSNVLVRTGGDAVVTDFGLARDLDASRFTQTGALLGTLATMAPEQVRGERVGPPADVWALGVMLFVCLTGRSPFDEGDTAVELSAAIVHQRIPSPRAHDPAIPEDLDATCRACLDREPSRRPTARQVALALRSRRAPGGRERRARRPPVALVAGVAALALSGLVGLALVTRSPSAAPAPPVAVATEPPSAPAPWGPPGEGWSVAWALDDGPAPQVEAAALWDEPGRAAAPLAAVLEDRPGAREAGLGGRSRDAGAGRIAVRYAHDALTTWPQTPPRYVESQDAPYPLFTPLDDPPGAAWLRSANDSTTGETWIGRARWRDAAVSLRLRRLAHEDGDDLAVAVGHGEPKRPSLILSGRRGAVSLGDVSAPLGEIDAWRRLRFAPGAAPGTRVVLDGAAVPALDAAAGDPAPPGRVAIETSEASFVVADVEVEGELLRPDRAALAWAPVDLPLHARVAVAFVRAPGEEPGGPIVTLGAPGGARYTLELVRGTLRLSRGERVVAARDDARLAGALTGHLVLERLPGDVVRGQVVAGPTRVALERVDPLPFPTSPLRAGWGSGAARVAFERVEVHAGPEAAPDDDPLRAWRQGALELAGLTDPEWFDPALVGRARTEERRARAAAAADALLAALERGLSGPAADDARVRAVLARAVAADAPGAAAEARRAVEAMGLAAAQERFAALEMPRELPLDHDGRGVLLGRFVEGYYGILDPEARDAALAAAEVLAPEHLGTILANRAATVRSRGLDPRSAAGRAAYEEAVRLFERARAAGVDAASYTADVLMDLGRYEEALAAWERARAQEHNWWLWARRGSCLAALGRSSEALESFLGALLRAPTRGDVHGLVVNGVNGGAPPGLAAAAMLALADARGEQGGSIAQSALSAARAGAGDPGRDGDLARYVLVRLGALADAGPASSRPTAVLARARAGAADARDALAAAGDEDPLVAHLAGLDPALRALLGR